MRPPATGKAPVKVGIAYIGDVNQFGAVLGANFNLGDPLKQAQAVIAWINAHGGLAGHRVDPVYTEIRATSTDTYDQMAANICTDWTQDNRVVAGIFGGEAPTPLAECLARAGVYFVNAGFYLHDKQDLSRWFTMVNAMELRADVGARAYVDALVAQRFLVKGERIGAIYWDYPAAVRTYRHALVPRLETHGLKVDVAYAIKSPASTPGISESAQAIQSAVLRMRAEGVTRILFVCPGCASTFMNIAEGQKYRPLYGLSTWDKPWALIPVGSVPAAQLHGARAVGWMPLMDVDMADGPKPNASARLCDSIMKAAGQPPTQAALYSERAHCDMLFQIYAAARGLMTVDGRALLGGSDRLGTRYASPLLLGPTRLGGDRHYGVTALRELAFITSCSCFRYGSRTFTVA